MKNFILFLFFYCISVNIAIADYNVTLLSTPSCQIFYSLIQTNNTRNCFTASGEPFTAFQFEVTLTVHNSSSAPIQVDGSVTFRNNGPDDNCDFSSYDANGIKTPDCDFLFNNPVGFGLGAAIVNPGVDFVQRASFFSSVQNSNFGANVYQLTTPSDKLSFNLTQNQIANAGSGVTKAIGKANNVILGKPIMDGLSSNSNVNQNNSRNNNQQQPVNSISVVTQAAENKFNELWAKCSDDFQKAKDNFPNASSCNNFVISINNIHVQAQAELDKRNAFSQTVFSNLLAQLQAKIDEMEGTVLKEKQNKASNIFNKKYNKAEDYLRQANDNPQIFTSSDYAFYENKINGLKTSFQQEQDKGNNTDFNKLNELSTQLDAVISDLEKIIQKEELSKINKKSVSNSDTISSKRNNVKGKQNDSTFSKINHSSDASFNPVQLMLRDDQNASNNMTRDRQIEIINNLAATSKGEIVSCSQCNGTGKITCIICNGNETIPCIICAGTGKTLYDSSKCTICNGTGKEFCSFCTGLGYRLCTRCMGAGSLFVPLGEITQSQKSITQSSNINSGVSGKVSNNNSSLGNSTNSKNESFWDANTKDEKNINSNVIGSSRSRSNTYNTANHTPNHNSNSFSSAGATSYSHSSHSNPGTALHGAHTGSSNNQSKSGRHLTNKSNYTSNHFSAKSISIPHYSAPVKISVPKVNIPFKK